MDAKKLFANLVMVANIDDEVAFREQILLDHYAKKLQLGFIEAQEVIDEVKSGLNQRFYTPKSQKAKNGLYKAVVKIVRVDKRINNAERKLLRRLGHLLKIPATIVEQAVAGQKPDFKAQIEVAADHTINVDGDTIDAVESTDYEQLRQQTIDEEA